MKKTEAFKILSGFTIMEVLVALVLIAIAGVSFMYMQKTSWYRTKTSSHLLKAGHIVEQEIENIRIGVSKDPEVNFPALAGYTDDSTNPGYHVKAAFGSAYSPVDNTLLTNVIVCSLTVSWGTGINDTLQVITNVAKDF